MPKKALACIGLLIVCMPLPTLAQYSSYGRGSPQSNSTAQYDREQERERQRREAEQERQREAREREREQARERERQAQQEAQQARERQAERERQAHQERERQAQQEQERQTQRERQLQQERQGRSERERLERERAAHQQVGRSSVPSANTGQTLPANVVGTIPDSNRRGTVVEVGRAQQQRQDPPVRGSGTSAPFGQAGQVGQPQAQGAGAAPRGANTTPAGENGSKPDIDRRRSGVAVNSQLYTPPPAATTAYQGQPPVLGRPLAGPASAFRGNEGQPVQRGYGDNVYRPPGTPPRVDPSRPSTFQTLSMINQPTPSPPGNGSGKAGTQGGAAASVGGNAASGNGGNPSASVKASYRKEPQGVPDVAQPESLKKPNGEYNCGPVNAYARQYEKDAGARALAVINSPYRSESRCTARCDALAWREELLKKYQYNGSWSCSSAAVGMWNAVGPNYTGYNNGNNGDGCTCIGSNGAPLAFSPEPK